MHVQADRLGPSPVPLRRRCRTAHARATVPADLDPLAAVRDPQRLALVPEPVRLRSDALCALAEVAAAALVAPRALVSLLTADHQVVVGSFGERAVGRADPVEETVCAFTIALGAPILLGDLGEDAIAAALPPAVRAAVKAYAGTSLRISGERVGTLCVTDVRARAWTHEDAERLEALAEVGSHLLAG